MKKIITLLIFTSALCLLLKATFAETVVLKSGDVYHGRIVKETPHHLIMKIGLGEISVNKKSIHEIKDQPQKTSEKFKMSFEKIKDYFYESFLMLKKHKQMIFMLVISLVGISVLIYLFRFCRANV